jgi:hypothetical protein
MARTLMRVPRSCWFLILSVALIACSYGDRSPPDSDGDSIADTEDCATGDPTRWQLLRFQSIDADGDTHYVATSGMVCSGASLAPPRSVFSVRLGSEDCNDADNTRWQLLGYVAVDSDLDGFSVAGAGQVCSGSTLPSGYGTMVPATSVVDCNDTEASRWRFMTTFSDADGDGIGSGAGTPVCIGSAPGTGFSLYGYDPLDDPGDPDAPLASNFDLPSWLLSAPPLLP